jgi:2-polyprenyl-3-methyl-5-hydroxy-6-metoxy-1,4-benzoquinol methylase
MQKNDPYLKDNKLYEQLLEKIDHDYKPLTLSPEYSNLVHENTLQFLIRLARYKFAARMLSKKDHVLEIGSGSGVGANFLGQHCASVKGLEIKDDQLKYAHILPKRDNVEFIKADFFDMTSQELFDAIVNLDVIEHMTEDIGEKFIAKTAQHLKETGMMIMGTPSIYSYEYQGALSRAAHFKCYDRDELVNVVQKYYGRVFAFSMNDELVHTGFPKLAWYYFIVAVCPKFSNKRG